MSRYRTISLTGHPVYGGLGRRGSLPVTRASLSCTTVLAYRPFFFSSPPPRRRGLLFYLKKFSPPFRQELQNQVERYAPPVFPSCFLRLYRRAPPRSTRIKFACFLRGCFFALSRPCSLRADTSLTMLLPPRICPVMLVPRIYALEPLPPPSFLPSLPPCSFFSPRSHVGSRVSFG